MLRVIFAVIIAARLASCQEMLFSRYDNDNSILSTGEECDLSGGRRGVCTEMKKCEWVMKLLNEKRTSEIVRCAFKGKRPLVCCPKSQKFEKALCGSVGPSLGIEYKITNGIKADIGEFPFQAALGRRNLEGGISFNCGGSLIADDVILTAAHCMNQVTAAATMVRLGRTSLNLTDQFDDSTGEDIDIETVRIHPKYNSRSRHNDIALLKLKRPATLSDTLKPICLAVSDKNVPTNLTVTGYGSTNPSRSSITPWLLKGNVQMFPESECKSMYKSSGKEVVNSQYCANSMTGVDACRGDSGGALSFKKDGYFYQYGVISYGAGCGSTFPALYTKVHKYFDWIGDEMLRFENGK